MALDALVLAGSTSDEPLRQLSESQSKAAVRLYGRLMIEYVLEALLEAKRVRSVTVAGAPDLVSIPMTLRRQVRWVKSGRSMPMTLVKGLSAIGGAERVLVVACDVPLITSDSIDAFISSAENLMADAVYPLVWRSVIQEVFPGVSKSYLRLKDGVFVGGNVALIPGRLTPHHFDLLQQANRWRKHPGTLAAILGWRGFAGVALSRITLAELEAIVSRRLGARVRGLPCGEVGIGFDVDRPSDYVAALRELGKSIGLVGRETPFRQVAPFEGGLT